MNRLSPLIERRPAPVFGVAASQRAAAPFRPFGDPPPSAGQWRLFATSYLAGLVFFGTYLA
ncbi:MAG TPA: hypothetical protein VF577_02000 [Allosphingosinicella sp.]|jgi:hypothetical protein